MVNSGLHCEGYMIDTKSVQINWLNSCFLLATPILAVVGIILHWVYFLHLVYWNSLCSFHFILHVAYPLLWVIIGCSHIDLTKQNGHLFCFTLYLEQVRFKTQLLSGALTTEGTTR